MRTRTKLVTAGVVAAAAAGLIATAAIATSDDDANDSDTPISGEALARASEAALAATGGGRVTETEIGDEDSYYEVEVTLNDGSQVDVQLDENFVVVNSSHDDEDDAGDDD